MPRDRRWDFLYDRQKTPVKAFIVERLGDELARDLEAWPPPLADWVPDELRARWGGQLADRPRDAVVRLALEAARLDLARDFDGVERLLEAEQDRLAPGELGTARLLARFLTERCLAVKEHAEGARLSRDDLAQAIRRAEGRIFRVTPA